MRPKTERVLVLISGQAATGKSTLGRALAKRLGIPYYSGGDALMRLARKMGFNARGRKWWDTGGGDGGSSGCARRTSSSTGGSTRSWSR